MTLANPTQDGQVKQIQLVDATNGATVNINSFQGSLTNPIVFSNTGDTLVLLSLGGQWIQISGTLVINQIAAAIASVSAGSSMVYSATISLSSGTSYSPSSGKYAVVNYTGAGSSATVGGVSVSTLSLPAGAQLYIGAGTTIVAASTTNPSFVGVEFQPS